MKGIDWLAHYKTMMELDTPTDEAQPVPARLGLLDAVCIVVGIVVGVGIFESPTSVFNNVSGPWIAIVAWGMGGVVSLIGALCFAELASTYPRSGGEYVYLTRAYGSWAGFLFAWAQLVVIRTGSSIVAPAFVFADYASRLRSTSRETTVFYAVWAIAALTLIHVLGVNPGKRTQNALTVAKVVGLVGIVLAGFLGMGSGSFPAPPKGEGESATASFALAMVMIFYAYDGWNEAVNVTAEVRDRRRNLPLALILGTLGITVLYLAVNAAYLVGLGFDGARHSKAVAADVLGLALGENGARAMSVLVMLSALGSVSGTIFTGSRLFAEMGADHRLVAFLARWDRKRGVPIFSLAIQAAISIAITLTVSAWSGGRAGFVVVVNGTAPVFWLFTLLTGMALFILRRRDRDIDRPFRVPLYPVLPLIFCGWCIYMLEGSIAYAPREALAGLAVLAAGAAFFVVSTFFRPPLEKVR